MSLLTILANPAEHAAEVVLSAAFNGIASFTIGGLVYERNLDIGDKLFRVARYLGNDTAGQDIRRLRQSSYELFRRMGQPVVVKPMLTTEDLSSGVAAHSPNFDDVYGQTRNEDPFSFGTGFVSIEQSSNEWYGPDGVIVTATTSPGVGYVPAPMYRGYGPGFLTYIIEPDAPVDTFQLTSAGALIRVQSPTVVAPWQPQIHDNDLIVNVEVGRDGRILRVKERYLAGSTSPVSIRGLDRLGRSEEGNYGNRNVVNQLLQTHLLPENNILYQVALDR